MTIDPSGKDRAAAAARETAPEKALRELGWMRAPEQAVAERGTPGRLRDVVTRWLSFPRERKKEH